MHNHTVYADALSRLPVPILPEEEDPPPEIILLMRYLAESPVTSRDICMETQQDPVLSSVLRNVRHGWPNSSDSAFSPFYSRRYKLSVQDGCLLWGSRVIVPPSCRKEVLNELHEAHPGISHMKALSQGCTYGGRDWTKTLKSPFIFAVNIK